MCAGIRDPSSVAGLELAAGLHFRMPEESAKRCDICRQLT